MFEKILVKSGSNPNEHFLPISDLIDMMFYYGEVHVIVSQFELAQLLNSFGEDVLYHLITSKRLFIHPCGQHIGAGVYGNDMYSIGLYSRNIRSIDSLLYQFHREAVNNSSENMRFASKFSKVLEQYKYSEDVQKLLDNDIYDNNELSRLTKAFVQQYYPKYGDIDDIQLQATPVRSELNGIFKIESNLRFEEFNKLHQEYGYSGVFSLTSVLLAIGETAADCCFTSEKTLELLPTLRWNGLYKQRMNDAINKVLKNKETIENFHNAEALDFLSPGVAFVNGNITSAQMLDELLGKTSVDFRNWLITLPNDANLTSQVNEAVIANGFQKWPVKVGRILFQIIPGIVVGAITQNPAIGTIVGTSTTVLDGILGDKILNGWNPRIFVNEVLRDDALKNTKE